MVLHHKEHAQYVGCAMKDFSANDKQLLHPFKHKFVDLISFNFNYVYLNCKVEHFNMGVNEDWLTFLASP